DVVWPWCVLAQSAGPCDSTNCLRVKILWGRPSGLSDYSEEISQDCCPVLPCWNSDCSGSGNGYSAYSRLGALEVRSCRRCQCSNSRRSKQSSDGVRKPCRPKISAKIWDSQDRKSTRLNSSHEW